MDDQRDTFEGWAIVELMGHRRLGGYVRETELAGRDASPRRPGASRGVDGCTCGSGESRLEPRPRGAPDVPACRIFRAPERRCGAGRRARDAVLLRRRRSTASRRRRRRWRVPIRSHGRRRCSSGRSTVPRTCPQAAPSSRKTATTKTGRSDDRAAAALQHRRGTRRARRRRRRPQPCRRSPHRRSDQAAARRARLNWWRRRLAEQLAEMERVA
jgi:hypothetical protein